MGLLIIEALLAPGIELATISQELNYTFSKLGEISGSAKSQGSAIFENPSDLPIQSYRL